MMLQPPKKCMTIFRTSQATLGTNQLISSKSFRVKFWPIFKLYIFAAKS
jgi:hypothetical protein